MPTDSDKAYLGKIQEKVTILLSLHEDLVDSSPKSDHLLLYKLLVHIAAVQYCCDSIVRTFELINIGQDDFSIFIDNLQSLFSSIHSLEDFTRTNSFSGLSQLIQVLDDLSHLADQWGKEYLIYREDEFVDDQVIFTGESLLSALEVLDLITLLIKYLSENQQIDKLEEFLSQIQTKADSRISSSLVQSQGIRIPADDKDKSTKYWEGVRDMVKLLLKKWLEYRDILKFRAFLTTLRSVLDGTDLSSSEFRRPGPSPTPFIYYFPYPKGPPAASANGKLKPTLKPSSDLESIISFSPSDSELDTRSFLEFLSKEANQEEE